MRSAIAALLCSLSLAGAAFTQIPVSTQIAILKAEDARRFDATLEGLLKSPSEQVRIRAALAAGRIGNAAAVPALVRLLGDRSEKVREMAAFALGETESIEAANA
ncbi:MAG: HEAT repeat domain-containing protein, partial [Blastocatellia bacterium]|nr:HEAT repeat domain-containing protein [Blastocatellia bacterium]